MADGRGQVDESQVVASDSADHENPPGEPSPGRVDRFLNRYRRTTAGRIAIKIIITVLGLAVIAAGIVLLPLPGPGWLIIFGGLAIWSLEYRWAARLRHFTMRTVARWTVWLREQPWWIRTLVLVGLAIVVIAIVFGSLAISIGVDRLLSIFG